MKKILKHTAVILLFCVFAVAFLCSCSIVRRNIIIGNWSEPEISVIEPKLKHNADGSVALVDYGYQITQTAPLKYPFRVWKDTDWQRKITERTHVVAGGRDLVIVDTNTGELSTLSITNTPTSFFKSSSGWIVFTTTNIFYVTRTDIKTILDPGQGKIIRYVSLRDRQVLFCIHKGWKAKCFSLNLRTHAITKLYEFSTSARNAPRNIVYLDEDRKRTIFVVESGPRAGSGTLGVGINEPDSTPVRTLHPNSMVKGATYYGWSLSEDKRELVLRFYEPAQAAWTLNLDTLTTSPSDKHKTSPVSRPVTQKNVLPPRIRQSLVTHLEATYLNKPNKKNLYKSMRKQE